MNIDAVARRAGVSPATVSRTLNGTARVNSETAARVLDAVKALHFVPNTNARSLGSGRSHLYGLIISDIANPFFPELVKAFEDLALQHEREVLIVNTDYELKRMTAGVMRLLQRRVDGVAIMTSEIDKRSLEILDERKVPTVFFDAGKLSKKVNVVRVDYTSGILAGMQHLHELGHRDVAFISGRRSLASAELRLRAFHQGAEHFGFRVLPEWIEQGDHRVPGGHGAALRLLQGKRRPTAIVCSNDLTAIGAMGAMSASGLRVPDDISIIGFDDIDLAAYIPPGLTTLRVPRSSIADAAFHMLLRSTGRTGSAPSRKRPEEHIITPELVLRGTTARPMATARKPRESAV